jgi:N-acetylneuraminate lyase
MVIERFRLTGLIAASFTPFRPDGSLALEPIERYAALLIRNAISGVFVCGTTGEGASMRTAERMQCVQRWVDVARGSLKVIAHVGHNSVADAKGLAEHAANARVDAIATVAPNVLKPASVEDLVEWCATVAAAAGETPYYYYHIPVLTGVRHDMRRFMALAAERIPTFAGIKFTDENLMEFGNCVNFAGARYNLLYGRDEILLAGLATGAAGAIGSTFNYSAPVYNRVMAAFQQGDMPTAMREMTRARNCVQVLLDFGGLPAGKAMLKLCGIDCGPVRLPLRTLPAERIAQMEQALAQIGWDELRCR